MYEFIRNLFCPFEEIEDFVPQEGLILDVGCGHGILARLMAKKSKERKILAIDPSSHKITVAKNKNKYGNIKFKNIYLEDLQPKNKFDCLTIIDVLYLLPDKEKINVLKKAKSLLKKKGTLILKEVNTNPRWMLTLSTLEEKIIINLLNYTHSDYRQTYISTPQKLKEFIKKSGFKLIKTKEFYGKIGYPSHIMFIAEKI